MINVHFENAKGLTLVGDYFPSATAPIIIMSQGFTSNRSSRGRFDQFAAAFHKHGYAVLKFDFSGCGDSDDDALTLANQVNDLKAGVSFAASLGHKKIAFYGHSLGSLVCLSTYTPEIETMILTGAGTGPMFFDWEKEFTPAQLKELKEEGCLTEPNSRKPSKNVIISQQMLKDFEDVDQAKLLEPVQCPVLIIHGNGDEEERMLLENSRKAMAFLPEESRLEVIDGAPHSFMNYLPNVEKLAIDWLHIHLKIET